MARPSNRSGQAIELLDDQQAAVIAAVQYPVTIVSGGPGTGKTTIVISMLRVFLRLGVRCDEIALAAPTGKAANRMSEAIRIGRQEIIDPASSDLELANLAEPRTLHRLLGYSHRTGRFIHHENNQMAERIVIVDEGSMIDLSLMERLVRSLRDDCRLILLGDAHQLPSVEAGAVLRDLLTAAGATSTIGLRGVSLKHSYRMRHDDDDGRNILAVAQAIDMGRISRVRPEQDKRSSDCRASSSRRHHVSMASSSWRRQKDRRFWMNSSIAGTAKFCGHGRISNSLVEHAYALVDGTFSVDDQVKLQTLFAGWERFRILCLTRVLPTGADRDQRDAASEHVGGTRPSTDTRR